MLLRQHTHAALGGMDTLQQIVERQPAVNGQNQFAIEDEFRRLDLEQRRRNFRKITRQRLAGFRLQLHLFSTAKGDTAKAIPLGLYFHSSPTGSSAAIFASMGRYGNSIGSFTGTAPALRDRVPDARGGTGRPRA